MCIIYHPFTSTYSYTFTYHLFIYFCFFSSTWCIPPSGCSHPSFTAGKHLPSAPWTVSTNGPLILTQPLAAWPTSRLTPVFHRLEQLTDPSGRPLLLSIGYFCLGELTGPEDSCFGARGYPGSQFGPQPLVNRGVLIWSCSYLETGKQEKSMDIPQFFLSQTQMLLLSESFWDVMGLQYLFNLRPLLPRYI